MGMELLWILFVVCLVLSAVGFYKYVYFLSIGYGFAVAGGAAAVAILFWDSMDLIAAIQLVLFVAYGIRLSGFLLVREIKNVAYRKTLSEAAGDEKRMPFFVKFSIWVCVALLYTAQLSPMFYRLYNGSTKTTLPIIGIVISVLGLLLEAAADKQKSAQKKERPEMVATKGLYKIVRCPNYLGEIIFWTGVFVGAWASLTGAGQWVLAVLAYVCIVYVMFNGAQRLEKRQMKRYGSDSEYQSYADTTPIILPFVPLYHLNKKIEEKKG